MDSITSASAPSVTGSAGSVQMAAGISIGKKAASLQAQAVATLLDAMPQPQLAMSGHLGTRLDTYA